MNRAAARDGGSRVQCMRLAFGKGDDFTADGSIDYTTFTCKAIASASGAPPSYVLQEGSLTAIVE